MGRKLNITFVSKFLVYNCFGMNLQIPANLFPALTLLKAETYTCQLPFTVGKN